MSHLIFYGLALLLMIPGLALVFIPAFPALLIMLLVALGFGFVDGFVHLTTGNLAILAGVFALSVVVDQSAGILGARYGGASRRSVFAGFLGMVIGTLLLPPLGGLFGLFIGVGVSELHAHKHHARAFKAAGGSVLGALAGMVLNAVLAAVFIILFAFFAWA